MKKYILFLNGNYSSDIDRIKKYISDRIVVAVDGGSNFCYKHNIKPNIIVGDLDSINEKALEKFSDCEIIKSEPDKDYLDFELALLHIIGNDNVDIKNRFKNELVKIGSSDDIIVFGATGNRVDMTLSNLKLLHSYPNMTIISEDFSNIRYLNLDGEIKLSVQGNFSIIPITDLKKLTLKGFKYCLDKKTIPLSFGLASNIALGDCYISCIGEMYIIYE